MNHTVVKGNEFILRVIDVKDQLRYEVVNPHTRPGADGDFDHDAFMAAYAMVALAGKIKRVKQKPVEDDESDSELYGG